MNRKKAFILAGALLGTLLFSLDQLIVATAAPKIAIGMHGFSQLSWVFTAYMLASTIIIPIYGKLSDIFGRRGLFILGIAIFLAGSLLSGLSQSMTQLIIFRALQGIGGGAMMVNTVAVIGDIFPPAERGKWQGLNMSMYGLATIAGPLLGGWITDSFSWRWVFYVNIPIGIITIALIAANMPKMVQTVRNRSVDFPGALVLCLGLTPLLLALVWGGSQYPWGSWQIVLLLCLAVFGLIAFVLIERKTHEPILSLSLFKNRAYVVSVLTIFMAMICLYGSLLYIPLFVQGVIGSSATNSGLILTPMMGGLIFASILAGLVVSNTGKYKVLAVIGMALTFLGMAFLIKIGVNTTNSALYLRMIVLGIGLGIGMPIFTTVAQSAFGQERLGEVTAGSQLFRNVGGTVGTAILGGIMNAQLTSRLASIQNDPFVMAIKQLNPSSALTKVNINTIQEFLSVDGQNQIKSLIAQAPQPIQSQLSADYSHFLTTLKTALSFSMDRVYMVGTIFMLLALVLVFFLPQIPLRKAIRTPLEEAESDMATAELGYKVDIEDD